MKERRSKDQMIIEILRICIDGENVTKIVYQSNTNFTTIKAYLDLLMKHDLVEYMDSSQKIYKTTGKGLEIMRRLQDLQKELEELVV
ncbi:Winged helix-turn-helix [uncultured archaeon]|nr:Winged helix-turn-helix [uncultured archaeon]